MLEKEKRKNNKKVILLSAAVLGAFALVVGTLMIVKYCIPQNKTPSTDKESYLFVFEPSLIDSTTALGEDNSLKVNHSNGNVKCTLTIGCGESNALLGSYIDHDFLYESYGKSLNTLTLNVGFTNPEVVSDYSDLEYVVYIGSKDNHQILSEDKYTVENSKLTYTASEDIYLYGVAVGVKI